MYCVLRPRSEYDGNLKITGGSFGSSVGLDIKTAQNQANMEYLGIEVDNTDYTLSDKSFKGYVSNLADFEGTLAGNNYITVTSDIGIFGNGITMGFENTYPRGVTVSVSDGKTTSSAEFKFTLPDTESENAATVYSIFYPIDLAGAKKITVVFGETFNQFEKIRLSQFKIGREYTIYDVTTYNTYSSIDIICKDVSIGTVSIEVVDDRDISTDDVAVCEIYKDNGNLFKTFNVNTIERTAEDKYTISGYDNISLLDNTPYDLAGNNQRFVYGKIPTDATLTTLTQLRGDVQDVLKDITELTGVKFNWNVPDKYKILFEGHIPNDSCRKVLALMCFACKLYPTIEYDGSITLTLAPSVYGKSVTPITIPDERILGEPTITKRDTISQLEWVKYTYYGTINVDKLSTVVDSEDEETEYTTYTFSNPVVYIKNVTPAPEDSDVTTISKATENYCVLKGIPKVEGYEYKKVEYSKIFKIENTLSKTTEKIDGYTLKGVLSSISAGKEYYMTPDFKKYMKSRGTMTAQITLGEEGQDDRLDISLGDIVTINSSYDGELTGMIISINSASEDLAEIEVMEWDWNAS